MAKRTGERGKKTGAKASAQARRDAADPNTMKPMRARERQRKSEAPGSAAASAQTRGKLAENSIRPAKRRVAAAAAPKMAEGGSQTLRDPEARAAPVERANGARAQTAGTPGGHPKSPTCGRLKIPHP